MTMGWSHGHYLSQFLLFLFLEANIVLNESIHHLVKDSNDSRLLVQYYYSIDGRIQRKNHEWSCLFSVFNVDLLVMKQQLIN